MLFNSLPFLVFFPLVSILYFVLPHKIRWILLLSASLFFYAWFEPIYLGILMFVIPNSWAAGLLIAKRKDGRKRKNILVLAVILNLAILFFFKYFGFFNQNINGICKLIGYENPIPLIKILLPLGISFYTFQAVSYMIDVYRGVQIPEKRLHIFSTFIVFYPQLVAGPIERAPNLLHQFDVKHTFDYQRVVSGLRLMVWGFFQKLVIADRLAIIVNKVYNNIDDQSGPAFVLATVFFAFQVYCDFSAYTNIARGAARVMGFSLMENFNKPFSARSISEFWRRWHISLSTWVNDYIFNPISFKRRYWGNWGAIYAALVTFFILGLWHGASWNFALFGLVHGIGISYELITRKFRLRLFKKMPVKLATVVGIFCTFGFYCFGGVFFRANSFADAIYIYNSVFTGGGISSIDFGNLNEFSKEFLGANLPELIFSFLLVVTVFMLDQRRSDKSLVRIVSEKPVWLRWSIYNIIILMILYFGVFGHAEFVYFQF